MKIMAQRVGARPILFGLALVLACIIFLSPINTHESRTQVLKVVGRVKGDGAIRNDLREEVEAMRWVSSGQYLLGETLTRTREWEYRRALQYEGESRVRVHAKPTGLTCV